MYIFSLLWQCSPPYAYAGQRRLEQMAEAAAQDGIRYLVLDRAAILHLRL
jgi:hypothetical protein